MAKTISKTAAKAGKQLTKLDDLMEAEYNPRIMSDYAAGGLQESMDRFGDISGIVWNKRTGRLVAGHQRVKVLRKFFGDKLKLDPAIPALVAPDGKTFHVRVVDWDVKTEKAANIAANNPHIMGAFVDDDLQTLLADLRKVDTELFVTLKLDKLALPDFINLPPITDHIGEPHVDYSVRIKFDTEAHMKAAHKVIKDLVAKHPEWNAELGGNR